MMRHITLLLDGLSRAAIVPFGSILIQKLSSQGSDLVAWSKIPFPLALAIMVYIVGRHLGSRLDALKFAVNNQQSVARVAGVTFALHILSLGAGLSSLESLLIIRFFAGLLSGFLSCITSATQNMFGDSSSLKGCTVEGADKLYTIGFAISAFLGGILYQPASMSTKFQALTGREPYTLTPMFLVFCSVAGEMGLRLIFWYSSTIRINKRRGSDVFEDEECLPFKTPQQITDNKLEDPLNSSRHKPRKRLSSRSDSGVTGNRQRVDTAQSETSLSEFYDCDVFESEDFGAAQINEERNDDDEWGEHNETDVAVYRDGRVVYENGSPAFVAPGDCEGQVPANYLECCGRNERKAQKMFKATQQWRWKNNVWRIHKNPHPHFEKIKTAYPHFLHGHTKEGHVIIYEQPGKMNLKTLFRGGCTVDDMIKHYIFFMEYIGYVASAKEELVSLKAEGYRHNSSAWRTCVVMDVSGISLSMLSGDVLKYLSKAGDVNNNHLPLTMKRVFIINAPFWLSGAWSSIKGLVPESVPVEILSSSKSLEGLRKCIDDDQIPEAYGGSSAFQIGEHPYETGLKDLVISANKEKGFGDQPIMRKQESKSANDQQQAVEEDEEIGRLAIPRENWESPPANPVRRRQDIGFEQSASFDLEPISEISTSRDKSTELQGGVLTLVSSFVFFWSAVQGSIECLVPLWILTPPILGGMGYVPSRAGTTLFCACIVLLWTMRTSVAKSVSQTPVRSPMRAFRVGVGAEFVLLLLIPIIPNSIVSVARSDSVVNMASTVILLATMALSSSTGRSAIAVLHEIACKSFVAGPQQPNSISALYGLDRLVSDCENGRFTSFILFMGEICGVLAVAPIYSWSVDKERPSPFDASCYFYLASFVALILYIASFSLYLNRHREFVTHPNAGNATSFAEIISVPLNDVMSLLEDANLSTPLEYSFRDREPNYYADVNGEERTLKKV